MFKTRFVERQIPMSKLSCESYKEHMAGSGQTLTGLGKWWGRKPLMGLNPFQKKNFVKFQESQAMRVLLSVKPEFAERIFDGSKKYEYRKAIFKNPSIKTVVVYASFPVRRVIGEFDIETVLSGTPENLWKETHEFSGITKEFFFDYFSKHNLGFAIKIKEVRLYQKPRCLRSSYNISPPQSFCYV